MSELFHVIEDVQIVLRRKGVYKQVKVYRRGNHCYAGIGSGFIKLMASGGTSDPNTLWEVPDDRRFQTTDKFYVRYMGNA